MYVRTRLRHIVARDEQIQYSLDLDCRIKNLVFRGHELLSHWASVRSRRTFTSYSSVNRPFMTPSLAGRAKVVSAPSLVCHGRYPS